MRCAIWYHLCNLKNVKNTHGGVLILVKLQASYLICGNKQSSELESNLQGTVHWGKKWLVDFNVGRTQLVLFDKSNNFCAINVKMNRFVLEEKSSFKKLGLYFSSKLDQGS